MTKIEIGQHGSYGVGSDAYPCTVVEVSPSGHRVVVEIDDFRAGPGHDYYGQQVWVFERRVGGERVVFTRRRNGSYIVKGSTFGGLSLRGWFAAQDPHY